MERSMEALFWSIKSEAWVMALGRNVMAMSGCGG